MARGGRRGAREGGQRRRFGVAAGFVLDAWGGADSWPAGESGGEVKPRREAAAPYFSGQRKKKSSEGWFCNIPKFQGLN